MPYGIASRQTEEVLAGTGLLQGLTLSEADDTLIEVDIVFEGALDESFAVRPEMVDDVVAILFEAISLEHPYSEFEVSAWDRTNPDDCTEVITRAHDAEEEDPADDSDSCEAGSHTCPQCGSECRW